MQHGLGSRALGLGAKLLDPLAILAVCALGVAHLGAEVIHAPHCRLPAPPDAEIPRGLFALVVTFPILLLIQRALRVLFLTPSDALAGRVQARAMACFIPCALFLVVWSGMAQAERRLKGPCLGCLDRPLDDALSPDPPGAARGGSVEGVE